MERFYHSVLEVLKQDSRFFTEDGDLLRNAVYEASMKMDATLIKILYENSETRARFFTEIDGVFVFDKIGFGWVVNNRELLPDSYTRYKNEIGLVNNQGAFISTSNDVELVFPYKDCVLEGGQTKEDQKKDEIFYNTTLAPDEVDRLLYPKVLTNAFRYENGKEKPINEITDEDNLIIKGNNLLALASLRKKYKKQVKLIYIDVPYNTGSDSFGYNDSFNHSTWLTFISNRLKVAKELLREDGCIFIQCDDNEQAYLKVLCDEIFGRENFVNCIAVKMSEATGVKMSHANIRFPKLKEYLLFYKRPGFQGFEEIDKYPIEEWDKENNIFLENITKEERKEIIKIYEKEEKDEKDVKRVLEILRKVKKVSLSKKMTELNLNSDEARGWLFDNSFRIAKTCGSSSLYNLVKKSGANYNQDIACALSRDNVLFFYITDYNPNTAQPRLRVIFADENIYKNPCDFWQDIKTTGAIANEGGVQLLNGKKPEKLLHRIIKMTTKPGDIVLDFFAGSGTTGAVSHKMNRRFIMCEQLDEHIEKEVMRLKNVINGDATGISETVDWQGGGTFVYFELAELNQKYVNKIQKAADNNTLISIWEEMWKTGFISSKVKPEDIDTKTGNFMDLSIEDKKRLIMELLDLNQLYINYCDIDDEFFAVSEKDKTFTKNFYGEV